MVYVKADTDRAEHPIDGFREAISLVYLNWSVYLHRVRGQNVCLLRKWSIQLAVSFTLPRRAPGCLTWVCQIYRRMKTGR